jgi:hypothetical protein
MGSVIDKARSPLKAKPLRLPGQSLDEARVALFEKKLEGPLLFAAMFFMLACMEWVRYLLAAPPSPRIYTAVAAGAIAFALWRRRQLIVKVRKLRLAMDGEKVVGQYLESLRERGYQVFHDVIGTNFNIDHVLIGPAGVFTVETKTWSKPAKGEAKITFDGRAILRGTYKPDRDPIIQASAQRGWLRELLKESTGREFPVWPVIVFPGWFVEKTGQGKKPLWVLEPKALPAFLEKEPVRMSAEDVKLATYHLSRFVRSGEAERR